MYKWIVESLYQPFPMLPGRRAQSWRHQPSYRRPRHFHAEPELNVVFRGHAVMGLGDHVERLDQGDVMLFHPGQDHVLLDASADLELFVVALQPDLVANAGASLARVANRACRLPESALAPLYASLVGLGEVADPHAVELQLVAIFAEVQARSSTNHVLCRRALQEVNADPELCARELARRLGVVPSVLSRQFHGEMSLTLVSYRSRQRAMAFIRLVDSGKPLTRAATEAGFGSYAQCHRVISKVLSCAPQRYFATERRRIDELRYVEGSSRQPL